MTGTEFLSLTVPAAIRPLVRQGAHSKAGRFHQFLLSPFYMDPDGRRGSAPTLRQLAIFDAVVSGGSAGAAARSLGLSQPAVTHALSRLELVIGETLLKRGPGGMAINAAGAILHRRTVRLRDHLSAALKELRPDASAEWVRIRLAAIRDAQAACHLAIAEQGSFRGAAASLAVSEPAIHRTARDLEGLVELPLYRRTSRNVSVTPDGAALAHRLVAAMAELAQAQDELLAARGQSAGRIALGCLPQMPKTLLAQALDAAIARHPMLSISLEENSYAALARALKAGRVDAVIGALRGGTADELVEQAYFEDPYVVVARADHPLTRAIGANPDAIKAYSWVLPPAETPRRQVLDRFFARLDHRPRVLLETNSVATTIAILTKGDALTLTARSLARFEFSGTGLALLDLPGQATQRSVGVTVRRGWLPTTPQADLLKELRRAHVAGRSSLDA